MEKPEVVAIPPQSDTGMKPMLEACLELVREMSGRQHVKPDDIRQLEKSVSTYTAR